MTTLPESITLAGPQPSPQLAIVLPVFKHSVLINEAINAALAQRTSLSFKLVIVNDGCPFDETHTTALEYARAYPDRIVYLRRRNGGLSAARNTGIDFVLKAWPSVRAIYFLDADNRLYPHALQRAWEQIQADPRVGWAFPDMDMFGAEINARTSGEYSILKHLHENYCEAGSLVKTELFHRGLRFDESMKLGFEDWDFWLQAIGLGYVGRHVESMGLRYRKRPESMLSNSERDRAEILGYMRRKHKALYFRDTILRLEHLEAPRYAIFLGDTNEVVLATDPRLGGVRMSWRDFILRFMNAWTDPQEEYCPNFLVFTTSDFLESLEGLRLLNWTFWRLEDALEGGPSLATAAMEAGETGGAVSIVGSGPGEQPSLARRAEMVMMTRGMFQECIRDTSANWLASVAEPAPMPPMFHLTIHTDTEEARRPPSGSAVSILLRAFFELRDLYHNNQRFIGSEWRRCETIARSDLYIAARNILKTRVLVPFAKEDAKERHVGFILPLVSFGGVEKVAINMARSIAKFGWRPHLFIMASNGAENIAELKEIFETISFLDDPICGRYDPSVRYFGTGFSSWVRDGDHTRALGLFMGMDAVINCHSTDAHALMGTLRRAGITTLAHLHLVDHDIYGEPAGIPYQVIAYEHSYQGVLTISQKLYDWCRGMGIPEGKLVYAPNAPSYPLSQETINAIMAERRARTDGKLRVAYIGRLDRQKGLDRLDALIRVTRDTMPSIEWRVVGGSVLAESGSGPDLRAIEPVRKPPTRSPDELTEHLAWADVLVMPSYFEGVPLMMLEAMRVGVVPVATRVGAVHEIVDDSRTGFLVESGSLHDVIGQMLRHLATLAGDRGRLIAMAEAAAQAAASQTWDMTAEAVAQSLDRLSRGGVAQAPTIDEPVLLKAS